MPRCQMHRHELLERAFDDPITLSDGTELLTLRDAISWLAKKVPKARHNDPDIQLAARLVTDAAENGGILMMAEIAMRRASRSGMEQRDEDG